MREIKFRGRNAELPACWIYGYFVAVNGMCYIHNKEGIWKIRAGTEGQYIGLKDKNGKDIFENDIVAYNYQDKRDIYTIIWDGVGFVCEKPEPHYNFLDACIWDKVEVIGNIHENPELLKEV